MSILKKLSTDALFLANILTRGLSHYFLKKNKEMGYLIAKATTIFLNYQLYSRNYLALLDGNKRSINQISIISSGSPILFAATTGADVMSHLRKQDRDLFYSFETAAFLGATLLSSLSHIHLSVKPKGITKSKFKI